MVSSLGLGKDSVSMKIGSTIEDRLRGFGGRFTIYRFEDPKNEVHKACQYGGLAAELAAEDKRFNHLFINRTSAGHNTMLNGGINVLLNLLIGAGGTAFSNANTRIGVGDSSLGPLAAQTILQGTNQWYTQCSATFPSVGAGSQILTAQASFSTGSANITWNEFGIDNNVAGGANTATHPTYSTTIVLLDRLTSPQNAKQNTQTWVPTITITES
jgi:hypothetical protein